MPAVNKIHIEQAMNGSPREKQQAAEKFNQQKKTWEGYHIMNVNKRRKMTDDDKARIHALKDEGISQKEIAEIVGFAQSSVSRCLNGRKTTARKTSEVAPTKKTAPNMVNTLGNCLQFLRALLGEESQITNAAATKSESQVTAEVGGFKVELLMTVEPITDGKK